MSTSPFDPADVVWTRVSPHLVRARLLVLGAQALLPFLGTLALAVFAGPRWLWAVPTGFVLLLVWLCWLVPRQVRAIGYAERADDLLVRKGIMVRSIVVVPYGRMQYVDVVAGPIQRRLGIAGVQLHTASPATDASIPGLPVAEAARLRDQLASRGEARLAGL